jgi:hypothetical protein
MNKQENEDINSKRNKGEGKKGEKKQNKNKS